MLKPLLKELQEIEASGAVDNETHVCHLNMPDVTYVLTLGKALRAIIEMIDDCPDAPRGSDSLPAAIRFYAEGALRGIDTGVA